FFQAEDGIRDFHVTGVQTCALPIFLPWFLYFLSQFRTWSDSTPFDFKLFVQFYATLLAVGAPSNIDQWLWPVLLIWALLLAGARSEERRVGKEGGCGVGGAGGTEQL